MRRINAKMSLNLGALALATAVLIAARGAATDAIFGVTSPVQVLQRGGEMSVSIASTGDPSGLPLVVTQSQLDFTATFKAGPSSGQTLTGTMLLRSDAEDGPTQVDGRLIPSTASSGGSISNAAAAAVQARFHWSADALKTAYRAHVRALTRTLRAALSGAGDDGELLSGTQTAAVQQFRQAFADRAAKYQADLAALTVDARAKLAALGVSLPDKRFEGGDDEHDNGYQVEGTITDAGQVDLTLRRGDTVAMHASGTRAADETLSGTFTGPNGTQGTWKTTPSSTNPGTMAGIGNALTTVSSAMSSLRSTLTARDKLDIADYGAK